MLSAGSVLAAIWIVFAAYWAVSAFNVKRNIRDGGNISRAHRAWFRIALIAFVVWTMSELAYRTGGAAQPGGIFEAAPPGGFPPAVRYLGAAIAAAGIGFAIWARSHLGRNWSPYPSLKEGHELVTAGPYRFVRHPIYTGIFAAVFGTALAQGPAWFVALAAAGAVFVWRIRAEERIMEAQFPREYREYRRGTKAFIPYIW